MVYPSRLRNLKEYEVKEIDRILKQDDYLSDISYQMERKTGKKLEELE